ncbi:hypothetical protein [Streptomyces sp. 4R-3d]|uniref:hypothetical protein n=1 Tax=Streptomyces sp. 4R-3d TaxID=2559605 RepID=UPI001071C4ED|nr:hypothetical protein [Streptomyces sp. 4R-3d]TFI30131.1 hypothetical protein E4P36_05115 [Streptomyces sp. 4R-3d]
MPETQTVWPEGVFARYATVGGSTVDLHNDTEVKERSATVASCAGCTETESVKWARWIRPGTQGYTIQSRDKGESGAREWAQAHAEKCRAMPRPTN